jgi:hypothetical protein
MSGADALPGGATPSRDRWLAALAYLGPLAATWLVPGQKVSFLAAFAIPIALAIHGSLAKRPLPLLHGFQAVHLLAAFALAAAFLGIVARPGVLRWVGDFGSIPLDAGASRAARWAFWLVALSRSALLAILGIGVAAGRDPVLPFFGRVPYSDADADASAAGRSGSAPRWRA